MADKGNVFTGARARLVINGKKVGYATGCDNGETIEMRPVRALDNIRKEENVPVAYDSEFSAEYVRVVGKSLKAAGIFPKNGTTPEQHLANILAGAVSPLTVQIEDPTSGKIIAIFTEAQATSRRTRVQAGDIVSENVSFVGIQTLDESET